MPPGFLGCLLFLLDYQWKWLFGFDGGVEVQERKYSYIYFETTFDL
jgi:hypothetical protein